MLFLIAVCHESLGMKIFHDETLTWEQQTDNYL